MRPVPYGRKIAHLMPVHPKARSPERSPGKPLRSYNTSLMPVCIDHRVFIVSYTYRHRAPHPLNFAVFSALRVYGVSERRLAIALLVFALSIAPLPANLVSATTASVQPRITDACVIGENSLVRPLLRCNLGLWERRLCSTRCGLAVSCMVLYMNLNPSDRLLVVRMASVSSINRSITLFPAETIVTRLSLITSDTIVISFIAISAYKRRAICRSIPGNTPSIVMLLFRDGRHYTVNLGHEEAD